MEFFNAFSKHWIGAFILFALAVDAAIIFQKLLVSRFNNSGIPGAFKSAVGVI